MLVVYCTVPDAQVAKDIASHLIQEKLAACVNVIPNLTSYYVYDGEFCESVELLLMIKTSSDLYALLEKRIVELHPYEVPEVISTDVTFTLDSYHKWVNQNLQ